MQRACGVIPAVSGTEGTFEFTLFALEDGDDIENADGFRCFGEAIAAPGSASPGDKSCRRQGAHHFGDKGLREVAELGDLGGI